MTAAVEVDTVTFTDQLDFVGFARDVLAGRATVGALPTDQGPLDWFERALPQLRKTPYEERLTRALATCLTDRDPIVRREALRFFESHPEAAGAERVVELSEHARDQFAGVPDPESKGLDLEWSLLRAVGARIMRGDPDAQALGRAEALADNGHPDPLIAALATADSDWVSTHAPEIVRKHPKTGSTILFNLERAGRNVGDLGEAIAPVAAAGDRKFREDIKRYLDDPTAKARILAATRRRKP